MTPAQMRRIRRLRFIATEDAPGTIMACIAELRAVPEALRVAVDPTTLAWLETAASRLRAMRVRTFDDVHRAHVIMREATRRANEAFDTVENYVEVVDPMDRAAAQKYLKSFSERRLGLLELSRNVEN